MITTEKTASVSQGLKEDLYKMIHNYFAEGHVSKLANRKMYLKIAFAAVWWLSSLVMIFTVHATPAVYFFLYVFHIFSQLYIMLNIGHDANHDAIVKNKGISNLLHYSLDICGINSYMWREMHHNQHHYVMNIDGEDEVLVARKLFRFTRRTKMRFMYRFQHIYTWFLYLFFSIDFLLLKDFECFFFPYTKHLKENRPPFIEYVKVFAFKILYVAYMFAPVYLLGYSFGLVFTAFLVGHMLIGFIAAMIIQVSHQLSSAEFPESKAEYDTFVDHVFATTADHSIEDPIANWCYGGLHQHIIHHLSPQICHTHFKQLTRNIKPIAERYHKPYRIHKNIFAAMKEHYLLLKEMSRDEREKQK
jgi:linoleoyl-CoA desaturase